MTTTSKTKHILCPWCAVDRDKLEDTITELADALRDVALFAGQADRYLCEQFPDYQMDEQSPAALLEWFHDNQSSPIGEVHRLVGQLRFSKQVARSALKNAGLNR